MPIIPDGWLFGNLGRGAFAAVPIVRPRPPQPSAVLVSPVVHSCRRVYNRLTMASCQPERLSSHPLPRVTVVLPTYNEADNIREMVAALLSLDVPSLHVLIVDDQSPDGTGTIADHLRAEHPDCVHVLHRTGERGLGRAYVDGFRRALDMGSDFVVQMDADFSHSPDYVPVLLSHMGAWDVVIGSRYVPGGGLDRRWSWGRRLLSWWANAGYSRIILGLRVRDATAGFKCWRREVLEAIELGAVQSGGYVFQVEMAYLCQRLGYRILEVPIYFAERRVGQSKMALPVKWEAAWRVWEIRWRHRRARPSSRRARQDAEGQRC